MKIDTDEISAARQAEASAEHLRTRAFWSRCNDTAIAPPAYYELQARVLREQLLPWAGAVRPLRRALDVGCGDGRFTLLIGEFASEVLGIDLSPGLVAQARQAAAAAGPSGVRFEARDAEAELPDGPFDLVSCMGVLSTLVDDAPYRALVRQLVARLPAGGHLITKDTVTLQRPTVRQHGAHSVHYRQIDDYVAVLRDAGLRRIDHVELARWSDDQVNGLWLWERVAAEARRPAGPAAGGVDRADQGVDTASDDGVDGVDGGAGPCPSPRPEADAAVPGSATLAAIAEHQDRQSDLLAQMANFLVDLGARLEAVEQRLALPREVDLQPLQTRLERIEGTLHWSLRQPRDPAAGPIRVAFLVHHAAAWPALRGIVDAMLADADFSPVILSLPHRFPVLDRMGGEAQVHRMLRAQGYAHVRIADDEADRALERLKTLNPQLIFRQAPWDADLPACLASAHLGFAKVCYVPYGYMTAAIEREQFDQDFHRLCWRIFCPDEAHRELFTAHNPNAGRSCRVTGYPKFDHLLRHRGSDGHWPVRAPRTDACRLIWAPHFSYQGDWLRFGVFDRIASRMLEFAAAHDGVEIVLRPHPALSEAMTTAAADSDLGRFRDGWKALPNTGISTEQEYADLFAASHLMLTDGLSFFSEYQLFDKPLVFFEREGHCGFNAAGARLLDGMYRVRSFDDFEALFGRLAAGREDDAVVAARRRVAAAIHPFPGEAARRIAERIKREIHQG